MNRGPRRLGVFYKEPVAGRVKTRLTPPLTPEEAATLYAAFLDDTLALVRTAAVDEVVLFDGSAPPGWTPEAGRSWRRRPQVGSDLGARMTTALEELLAGPEPAGTALLIGSDCPTLSVAALDAAFDVLERKGGDLALGPALDGGYVVIGVSRAPGALLLSGIPWSTATTLSATEVQAVACGWRVARTPGGADVDTPEDLAGLLRELDDRARRGDTTTAPRTRQALSAIREKLSQGAE